MTKSKARGTAAETSVVRYLQANGFPKADRSPLRGSKDMGDIVGVELDNEMVVLEVKNCAKIELAKWQAELAAEKTNASTSVGAVIAKRKGTTNVGDWYAVMTVDDLLELLKRPAMSGTDPQ